MRHCCCRWLGVTLLLSILCPSPVLADRKPDPDEEVLRRANVNTDDASLLAFLRQRSQADRDVGQVARLVGQLGSDDFRERESASRRLVALDLLALRALRRVTNDVDKEVARRAQVCVAAINRRTPEEAPLAIIQLLLRRKASGTVEALIRYVPYAHDEAVAAAIYFGLDEWAARAGRVEPALVAALEDAVPGRRALAACILGRLGNSEQRAAVRKCLRDGEPEVRLRAAQGLLAGKDTSGLPALIALLREPDLGIAWQAEELLHYAAGEESPKAVVGQRSGKERQGCRAAWEQWLRTKGKRIALAAVNRTNRRPGLLLVLEETPHEEGAEATADGRTEAARRTPPNPLTKKLPGGGGIWLCGCEGQPRCRAYRSYEQFAAAHLPLHSHSRTVVSGHDGASYATQMGLIPPAKYGEWGNERGPHRPQYIVRLDNGNRLIGVESQGFAEVHRIIEVNRSGGIVWESAYDNMVSGLSVWPVLRVGFGPRGGGAELDSVSYRTQGLKHTNAVLRRLAGQFLEQQAVTEAVLAAAIPALDDSDLVVRLHAARIIRKAGKQARRAIPGLVRLLTDKELGGTHSDAAYALRQCGGNAIPALVSVFEETTGGNRSRRRAAAIGVLAHFVSIPDRRLHRALKAAFQDPDSSVRETVAWELCNEREKAKPYVREMIRLLEDRSENVASSTAMMMQRLGKAGEEAVPALLQALNRAAVRDNAIRALGEIGRNNPEVLPALLKQLRPGQEVSTCFWITVALGKYRKAEDVRTIVPVLEKLLEQQRSSEKGEWRWRSVRVAAIDALGGYGAHARRTTHLLLSVAKQNPSDPAVLMAVVGALKRIDPRLANQLTNPEEAVLPATKSGGGVHKSKSSDPPPKP